MELALKALVFIFCASLRANGCEYDAMCKNHQVCCENRCTSWPKCFLNTNKECFYDTHCVRGKKCESHVCIMKKTASIDCTTRVDCLLSTNTSIDCCNGTCLYGENCTRTLPTEKNSTVIIKTKAVQTSPILSSSCPVFCPTGFECVNKTCTALPTVGHSTTEQTIEELSDEQHSSINTGLLSAALFSAAVFISFLCFCFLKETKYYRRICFDNQDTLPTTCPHQRSVSERIRTVAHVVTSYHLYDHPPPSYDEAMSSFRNTKS